MRLIDADALMLTFNDWWYSSFGQEENEQSLMIKEAMKAIEDAPTVDAVEVVKQAFSGEMKLMPAENATFANPYKTVLEDLKEVPMFTGKYDAKNGNIHFMYGISTVLEYIADKAGDEEYEGMFLDNLNKSVYGDKAE